MNTTHLICFIASIIAAIGAINWGLVGLANYNLVTFSKNKDCNNSKVFPKTVYSIVGLAGIIVLYCQITWFMKPSFSAPDSFYF